jgi:hypothetical protein
VGFSPFTPPSCSLAIRAPKGSRCALKILGGRFSVHPRPAAAPLVLLAGAAGTHFIPTDFGGSASWFAPLATERNLPSLTKILVGAQEPSRRIVIDGLI